VWRDSGPSVLTTVDEEPIDSNVDVKGEGEATELDEESQQTHASDLQDTDNAEQSGEASGVEPCTEAEENDEAAEPFE
jgi:hypothetical protein